MLKGFWPSGPSDQMTPRASALNEQHNPFDTSAPDATASGSASTSTNANASASPARAQHASSPSASSHGSGATTPHLQALSANASPRASGGATSTRILPNGLMPSGLRTPGGVATQATVPTTSLSTAPPDFNILTPQRSKDADLVAPGPAPLPPPSATGPSYASTPSFAAASTSSDPAPPEGVPSPVGVGVGIRVAPPATSGKTRSTSAPKGQLTVTILGARSLPGTGPNSRPYAVVSFDKNEFVGREPINAPGHAPVPTPSWAGEERMVLKQTPNGFDPIWEDKVTFDVTYEGPKVFISVYDRQAEDEGFLGMRDITPVLREHSPSEQWYPLIGREFSSAGASIPVEGPSAQRGEILVKLQYERRPQRKLTPRDFEYMKLIGRGTFGRVFQVRKKDTRRIYAMKVLNKREIALKKEVVHTMGERKILEKSLDCPFLVGLKFSFQSETELFFVTDYKSGGELFWHLQREGRFTEERAKFYIAELVLALEHLHKFNIVYRDLKPENILLDAMGHVALCDFGLSKPDLGNGQLTSTFCGTTEYLAPEVLLDETGYSKLVDFWSLGVLLFEMCCGWSPFYAEDTQQMYRNICFGKIKFPRGAIGDDGKQFVKGLLNRNPKHRLGALNDAQDLREHPFFKSVDWSLLASKKIPPPFKPLVESEESVANFDPEFTETDLRSVVRGEQNGGVGIADDAQLGSGHPPQAEDDEILSSSIQHQFSGFSYSGRGDDWMGASLSQRSRRGSNGVSSSLASRGGTSLSMSRMGNDLNDGPARGERDMSLDPPDA